MAKLRIAEADLEIDEDAAAVVEIIDSYARGPGGQNAPLSDLASAALARGLREHPCALVLLAREDERPVGVAVCVWGFSTFAGREMINIHDLAVLPGFRGRGVGSALLVEVERRARERGCCKITLEVHDANEGAKRLYAAAGFGSWDSPTWFLTRPL